MTFFFKRRKILFPVNGFVPLLFLVLSCLLNLKFRIAGARFALGKFCLEGYKADQAKHFWTNYNVCKQKNKIKKFFCLFVNENQILLLYKNEILRAGILPCEWKTWSISVQKLTIFFLTLLFYKQAFIGMSSVGST